MSFRLAIMTTTYRRPEVADAVFDWWRNTDTPGVQMTIVSGGDGEYGDGTNHVHHAVANEPLGRKHNITLRKCRRHRPDGVMVIGSDDIVEPALIAESVEAIRAGAMWTQPRDLYFWHPQTGGLTKAMHSNLTGAGRIYSTRLLDVLGWHLWEDGKNSKLDGSAEATIHDCMRAKKVVWGDVHKGWPWAIGGAVVDRAVLDIKSDVNVWPYEDAVAITRAAAVDSSILERFEIERLKLCQQEF